MDIKKVDHNFYLANQPLKQGQKRAYTPNFTARPDKYATKEFIRNALPKSIINMEKLEWMRGELGGIIITALGTGLVAPVFIGFNPFVKPAKNATAEEKEDMKNTKIYTAMRQPISAVLAILFQASILKPIDKFLDTLINKKENAKKWNLHMDHSAVNSKSYVQSEIAKKFKSEGKVKPSYFGVFRNGFDFKSIHEARKVYNKEFSRAVDNKMQRQLNTLAKSFMETGEIKIGDRLLDQETIAKLINNQADEYIKDAKKLIISEKGIDFYMKRSKALIENEAYLKEIFKDIPHAEIKKTFDEKELSKLYKQTENIVRNLYTKETNPEVKELLSEILSRPEDLRAKRIARTLDRIKCIKTICGGNYSPEAYKNFLDSKNNELKMLIERLENSKVKELGNVTKETVQKSMNSLIRACKFEDGDLLLKSILHDTDTFDSSFEKLSKKVHKDITKLYKNFVQNSYRSTNLVIKVIIGVFITLPITCNALNWVYPRFMDLFFPELSGAKKNADVKKVGGGK